MPVHFEGWSDIGGNFNPNQSDSPINPHYTRPLNICNPSLPSLSLREALELRRQESKTIGPVTSPHPNQAVCGRKRMAGPWKPCHLPAYHRSGCMHYSSKDGDNSMLMTNPTGDVVAKVTNGAESVSASVSTNSTTTSTSSSEPEMVVEYGADGRPLPRDKFAKGYEFCGETQKYEHNSITVYIKGHGNRVIWPGKDRLGFAFYVDEGYTVVRIYEIEKKICLSTKWFDGNISRDKIREVLFDGAEPSKDAREVAKKGGKPYKAAYRYALMSKADFDKRFKPNLYRTNNYNSYRGDDTALKSIGQMLRSADGGEVAAGHVSSAINNAMKRLRAARQEVLKASANVVEWPCVEVYAIWTNYDMDARLIYSNYDASEPLFYMYHVFNSPEEMNDCAL